MYLPQACDMNIILRLALSENRSSCNPNTGGRPPPPPLPLKPTVDPRTEFHTPRTTNHRRGGADQVRKGYLVAAEMSADLCVGHRMSKQVGVGTTIAEPVT